MDIGRKLVPIGRARIDGVRAAREPGKPISQSPGKRIQIKGGEPLGPIVTRIRATGKGRAK